MLFPLITLGQLLDAPGGAAVADRHFPMAVTALRTAPDMQHLLIGSFMNVTPGLREDSSARDAAWAEIDEVMRPVVFRLHDTAMVPSPRWSSGERGSAPWTPVGEPTRWGVLELEFEGPREGNPFVDVDLSAVFTCADRTWTVGGFYDGDGVYRVRVLAEEEGAWQFATQSTAAVLDGIQGEVRVAPAKPVDHGPVRTDGFHFRHADGTRYRPWGTTAYAWNHQDDQTQEQTIETLSSSSFNKLRMCLFPKHYAFNTEDPDRYPFIQEADGTFDHARFDLDFFRRLDHQVRRLGEIGVQADLILFHPYDCWGFANLGPDVDALVVRYVVRRLAGYANVWFSLANEYELLVGKSTGDWEKIGELVSDQDPHRHLLSIHNWVQPFDHTKSWVSHASVQHGNPHEAASWRAEWKKPVVVDECGYEGDIEYDWGNISGEEMLRRIWDGAVRGAYVGHGETYWAAGDRIWWSKGGRLDGESHKRIAFLDEVVGASPTGVLEPLPNAFDLDVQWAGVQDRYLVAYHGIGRPRQQHVLLPPGNWHIEVLDTWDCTVTAVPGIHETYTLVPMPAKSFQAIRLVASNA